MFRFLKLVKSMLFCIFFFQFKNISMFLLKLIIGSVVHTNEGKICITEKVCSSFPPRTLFCLPDWLIGLGTFLCRLLANTRLMLPQVLPTPLRPPLDRNCLPFLTISSFGGLWSCSTDLRTYIRYGD